MHLNHGHEPLTMYHTPGTAFVGTGTRRDVDGNLLDWDPAHPPVLHLDGVGDYPATVATDNLKVALWTEPDSVTALWPASEIPASVDVTAGGMTVIVAGGLSTHQSRTRGLPAACQALFGATVHVTMSPIPGPPGPPTVITIGSVTTAGAGSPAAAEMVGDAPNQTLNLTLPKGDKGDKGNTGNTGPANSLSIGAVTTSAPGAAATASITGSAPSQTLNLTLPRGDVGPSGDATLVTAKGDLLAATGAATLTRLAVGGAGQLLVPDPSQPPGLRWASPAGWAVIENLVPNPQGPDLASAPFRLRTNWFGAGASGTVTPTTAADTPLGTGITSYIRKRWTVPGTDGASVSFTLVAGPVTAGLPYTVSLYWRTSYAGALVQNRLNLIWRDSGGAQLGSVIGVPQSDGVSSDWVRVWATAVAPAGAVSLQVDHSVVLATAAPVDTTLDGTGGMVTQTAHLTPYFDGSTGAGAWWSGTPGASPSGMWSPPLGYTPLVIDAGRPDLSSSMSGATRVQIASAANGTLFQSTDRPQGAALWMLHGTTWRCINGDTGWRLMPLANGWTGNAYLRRINDTVHLQVDAINASAATTGTFATIPTGFGRDLRGGNPGRHLLHSTHATPIIRRTVDITRVDAYQASDILYGEMSWSCAQAWPTTLPGT